MAGTEQTDGRGTGRRGVDALWRRSPFLLFRHPALMAAIAIGALLLTLAVAAYPLFMSGTTSELLRTAIERPSITRYGAGMTFTFRDLPLRSTEMGGRDGGTVTSPFVGELDDPFRGLAAASPVLDEPIESVVGDTLQVSLGERAISDGRLFASTGVLDAVERLSGSEGNGVWLSDFTAEAIGAGPGDEIRLHDPDEERGPTIAVRVDGIYRAIYPSTVEYWLAWAEQFRLTCFDCRPPPQPILVEFDQALDLSRELEQASATFRWQAPIADPSTVSLSQARAFRTYQRDVNERMTDPGDPEAGGFLCCQRWFYAADTQTGFGTALTVFDSSFGYAIDEAERRIVAVEGPSRVLGLAGAAVALVVVAAAGAFSIRARRIESAWLFARGTSAAVVGLKTALESVFACLVGGALGFGLAWLAVSTLGPDGRVDPAVFAGAAWAAGGAVVGAVALVSLVAAWTHVRVVDPHGRRFARLAAFVPWELGIAALAYVALQQLRKGGAFVTDEQLDVVRPSLALVAFPFLLLTGFAILAARLARLGLDRKSVV